MIRLVLIAVDIINIFIFRENTFIFRFVDLLLLDSLTNNSVAKHKYRYIILLQISILIFDIFTYKTIFLSNLYLGIIALFVQILCKYFPQILSGRSIYVYSCLYFVIITYFYHANVLYTMICWITYFVYKMFTKNEYKK